jgi:NADH-quinone oxidoreductase subunit H
MAVAAYSTWAERKVAAIMQDRIGPNRTWKFGLLQPLADGGKFFFKEDFIPEKAEKFFFFRARFSNVYFINYRSCYSLGKL